MRPQTRTHRSLLVWMLVGLWIAASTAAAQDTDTAEGLILTVALAQDLAREALDDSVAPIGSLLNQIGPSCVFAAEEQGFGRWSLSLGATASKFSITSPDYTLGDPRDGDRIDGGIGAVFADLSLGLFRGYRPSETITTAGSVDLMLRLGYSLGDQDNLAEKIDLGSWAPIYGGGLRFGLLKGPRIPSVSLSAGANSFQRRVFTVQVEDENAAVSLDFEQTSAFLLLEVGKSLGWATPYFVGGLTHHRLQAEYTADIIYGSNENLTATIHDAVDNKQTVDLFFLGVEFGSDLLRLDLEVGTADGESFGRFFLRFSG